MPRFIHPPRIDRLYADLSTVRDKGHHRTLILGVEEPELYMHPPMLRSVRKVLRKLADTGDQVFFTTHNPGLIDVGFFDEIIGVESDSKAKRSVVCQLSMEQMINAEKPAATIIGQRVAYFKTAWERELMGEIPEYEKLAGEATRSLGLRSDTGEPLRARYIAIKLSPLDKPLVPPTIEKIIRQAIQVSYSGTCLKRALAPAMQA